MTTDIMVSGQGYVQKHDGKSGKNQLKHANTLSRKRATALTPYRTNMRIGKCAALRHYRDNNLFLKNKNCNGAIGSSIQQYALQTLCTS